MPVQYRIKFINCLRKNSVIFRHQNPPKVFRNKSPPCPHHFVSLRTFKHMYLLRKFIRWLEDVINTNQVYKCIPPPHPQLKANKKILSMCEMVYWGEPHYLRQRFVPQNMRPVVKTGTAGHDLAIELHTPGSGS